MAETEQPGLKRARKIAGRCFGRGGTPDGPRWVHTAYAHVPLSTDIQAETAVQLLREAVEQEFAPVMAKYEALLEACRKANTCASLPDNVRALVTDAIRMTRDDI